MDRWFHRLRPLIRLVVARPSLVLLIGLLLSVAGGYGAAGLQVDRDISKRATAARRRGE